MLCTLKTRGPGVSQTSLVPTMAAVFLDENLPDGTCLEPGTKFIKYWKIRNSGTISWTSETKLVFMWGNLGLASEERREVPVPPLLNGQVGVVKVAFVAPMMEGTYASHWRLAHCGCQFGPRVWCSIVVDPSHSSHNIHKHQSKRLDLLSFELLDINIVQELEKVSTNTPVGLTPCISHPPHDEPVFMETITTQMKEGPNVTGIRKLFGLKLKQQSELSELVAQGEERDISRGQFVCETVIRSLALEEAPDHKPVLKAQHGIQKPNNFALGPSFCFERSLEADKTLTVRKGKEEICAVKLGSSALLSHTSLNQITQEEETRPVNAKLHNSSPHNEENEVLVVLDNMQNTKVTREEKEQGRAKREDWDEVSSQTSSASSCDDYMIVLPDCFDTSHPLGEFMYSSAMSQPDKTIAAARTSADPDIKWENDDDFEQDEVAQLKKETQVLAVEDSQMNMQFPPVPPVYSSVNQIPCDSHTLNTVTPTPEVVPQLVMPDPVLSPLTLYSPRSEGMYLAEDPHPLACKSSEPHQPQVQLSASSGLSISAGSASSAFETYNPRPIKRLQPRGQGGITEGLVKGALSVAASAYKALFTGPNCSVQRGIDPAAKQNPSLMAMLLEMGFRDQRLNQRLLRKHSYSLLHTINELVQISEDSHNKAV